MASAKTFVNSKIRHRKVILFSKSYNPDCRRAKEILNGYKMKDGTYEAVEIENRQDCSQIENYFQVLCLTDNRSVPQLFVRGKYIGGQKEIEILESTGALKTMLTEACLL